MVININKFNYIYYYKKTKIRYFHQQSIQNHFIFIVIASGTYLQAVAMALLDLCGFLFPILGCCSGCETAWVVFRRPVCLSDSPFGISDISITIGIAAYGNSSGRCLLPCHFVSRRNCSDSFLTIRYQTNWRSYITLNYQYHYYISK